MNGCAVGITAAIEQARYGAWDQEVTMAPRSYARTVQREGGLALLLPPDDVAEAAPERWLDRIDALLVSGGSDIDPAIYGQAPHPETKAIRPDRDRFEIALARGALDRGIPLLGVCRGMQVLNVACGGTLDQHIPERLGTEIHRPVPGSWAEHDVRLESGSLAAQAAGTEQLTVKSHHHQGVDRIAENLRASAWATDDESVEAIESGDGAFVLGVLWHPEEDAGDRLIPSLIEQAST
jgi:putative glutamine amidotransferase